MCIDIMWELCIRAERDESEIWAFREGATHTIDLSQEIQSRAHFAISAKKRW